MEKVLSKWKERIVKSEKEISSAYRFENNSAPIVVVIRHNKFFGPNGSGRAIWMDWGSLNVRITGNLIMNRVAGVFTEVSFGPTVIDNNIFISSGVLDWSDGNIYAHNLFFKSPRFHLMGEPNRPFVPYYRSHSTGVAGRNETKLRCERWFNNIIIGGSAGKVPLIVDKPSGFVVNNNLYLDGEPVFPFEGDESIIEDHRSKFKFDNNLNGILLSFHLSKHALAGPNPIVTSGMVGKMPLPEVFMENPDSSPLDITSDYFGNEIDPENVKPGPFQKISAGDKKFRIW